MLFSPVPLWLGASNAHYYRMSWLCTSYIVLAGIKIPWTSSSIGMTSPSLCYDQHQLPPSNDNTNHNNGVYTVSGEYWRNGSARCDCSLSSALEVTPKPTRTRFCLTLLSLMP